MSLLIQTNSIKQDDVNVLIKTAEMVSVQFKSYSCNHK